MADKNGTAIDKIPLEKWKVIDSTYSFRDRWLALRSDTVLLPDGSTLAPYHTLECSEWVNVIAVNDAGEIILVEQYRHGAKRILFEIPGGNVDSGEAPEAAAQRELLEETGYAGGNWHSLGTMFAAAARLTNQTHCYLALGVRRLKEPSHDEGEIFHIHEMKWEKFAEGLRSGAIPLLEANQLATLFRLQIYTARSVDPRISQLTL